MELIVAQKRITARARHCRTVSGLAASHANVIHLAKSKRFQQKSCLVIGPDVAKTQKGMAFAAGLDFNLFAIGGDY